MYLELIEKLGRDQALAVMRKTLLPIGDATSRRFFDSLDLSHVSGIERFMAFKTRMQETVEDRFNVREYITTGIIPVQRDNPEADGLGHGFQFLPSVASTQPQGAQGFERRVCAPICTVLAGTATILGLTLPEEPGSPSCLRGTDANFGPLWQLGV